MAGAIGDVAVRVGADIEPLKKGLNKGSKAVGGFNRDMGKAAKQAVKYNAALVAVAASGLALITKETAAAAKETKNLAFLANAGVEQFQRWSFASKSVGVEQDKLSDILKDFNDRIGDFVATGGGPMVDFFERIGPKIGVTIEQFRKLSGPQALELYYNSLEKANLSQEDMTFFMESMASDSTALIPLLRNNAKGIKDLASEADRFNVILSESDIEELTKVDRAFADMGAAISGAAKQLSLTFIPEIENIKKAFVGVVTQVSSMIKGLRKAREESKKIAEAEKQIQDIVGSTRRIRGRAAKEGNAEAREANTLLLRQIELEGLIASGFSRQTGQASKQNKRLAKAHEEKKARWSEELEANKSRVEQLAKESDAAQRILDIRSNSLDVEREIAIEPEVKDSVLSVIDPDADNKKKKEADELDAIKSRYITKQELERQHAEEMAIIGSEYDSSKFDTEEEWRNVTEQAEQAHLDRMIEMNQTASRSIVSIIRDQWGDNAASTAESMKSIIQTMGKNSKKAFKITKAWALTDAILSTYQGIAKGVAAGYPQAIPLVAAAAATGFAQVSAIRGQSFGGGRGGSGRSVRGGGGGGGGGGGDFGGSAVNQQQQSSQPTKIVVEGLDPDSMFDGRTLTALLQEAADNGSILVPG